MTEMYHYPMLCVGWFGLLVTALNLLPVGQLDGGHITYALFYQKTHRIIGIVFVSLLAAISIPELLISTFETANFHFPKILHSIVIPGGSTWIFWVIMIVFIIRLRHPAVNDDSPLDMKRQLIGYLAILIFILSFTPSPLVLQ
jgi:membrane-associated protease RseP (regulator of RpoE activity)